MRTGKVLLVANTDWYLYNFRLSLARFLRSLGLEVVMVAPPGEFSSEMESEGFRFIPWNVGRRSMLPTSEVGAVMDLSKIYQAEKPFLVHHFTIKPVLYGSLAAKITGVPSIVNSVTGLGYIFLKEGWKGDALRSFILPLYRFALSGSNFHVIFENENDQYVFGKLGLVTDNESVVIRGVGVDAEYFHPTQEPYSTEPLVVFPSRMLLDKGLGTLVEAARILKGKANVRIALVGSIDLGNPTSVDERAIRGWEQEGLVEWWGFQRDMRAVYQNSNLVTLPSYGEGLPTVLIEAAACGRAIVSTDVAGCRDVVENGVSGILVPAKQPEALAQAIEKLACDAELRARMGSAGRQIVLQKFTDKQVNQETIKVYARLIDRQQTLTGMIS